MSNPLFDPERYQAVRKPLLEAATLPPACYTSTEFFEREIERVFLRNWQFVGREEQLEAPGDYFCYEGPGGSVIIMRTAERQLKAYANSCRHRGSRLLSRDATNAEFRSRGVRIAGITAGDLGRVCFYPLRFATGVANQLSR
jgi:hypothetical protein